MRGVCPVTYDVEEDEPCQWDAEPRPAESRICSVNPDAVEDPADQQREPDGSQTDSGGEEDDKVHGTEDIAGDETDSAGEEDDKVREREADIVKSSQGIPGGSEQLLTAQRRVPESDDPCERPRSLTPSSEPAAAANSAQTCEMVTKEGAGELHDDYVGVREESPEEAVNESELRDEAVETTEEGNPERSCSAKPDVDSSFTLCKPPEKLISRKRDHHAQKRDSRSLRPLEVLQASVVPQLW